MTLEQVRERIKQIQEARWDFERAHGLEDALHRDVLEAIADQSVSPVTARRLAALALTTRDIAFPRHMA